MDRLEKEKEWAEIAKMEGCTDFHELDECNCGGKMGCWTRIIPLKERYFNDGRESYFSSSWFCYKCEDQDYRTYDRDMNEI